MSLMGLWSGESLKIVEFSLFDWTVGCHGRRTGTDVCACGRQAVATGDARARPPVCVCTVFVCVFTQVCPAALAPPSLSSLTLTLLLSQEEVLGCCLCVRVSDACCVVLSAVP